MEKRRVKMLKNRLFEIKKKSEIFFRDLHLISSFLCSLKKYGFFRPCTMDISDHGTKSDPKGTFELCPKKNIFLQKSNKNRIANNVSDCQNNFHEDRVYGAS
jgi:hypothetical protein